MNVFLVRKTPCAFVVAALVSLVSGCIDTHDMSTVTANDTGLPVSATTSGTSAAAPADSALLSSSNNSSSASTSPLQSSLTDSELQLLQSALAGLAPGSAAGSSSTAPSATPSLSDLKTLGLDKRDIAILALDWAAQQSNLTPEQSFALRLAKALVSRDTNALTQLLIEQLPSATGSGSSASASQGATP